MKESNRPRASPSVVCSGLRGRRRLGRRIEEQRRLCGALVGLPAPRAPVTLPGSWSPQFAAAEAGAGELEAAARQAAQGDVAWFDRLNTDAVAKAYLQDRKRMHPHLVGRGAEA